MRAYATREDTGKRVLIALVCDGCGKEIKPNPSIAQSGWKISGVMQAGKTLGVSDWCPECAEKRGVYGL